MDIKETDIEDHFDCDECLECNYVIGDRVMSYDDYYESCCESAEAARYEEAAYGNDRDEYIYPSDTQTFRDDKWD
jgi:hypothetical protein